MHVLCHTFLKDKLALGMTLLKHPNNKLNRKCRQIYKISSVKKDLKELVTEFKQMHKVFFLTTGLAAPQIGINKKLIVFTHLMRTHVLINPEPIFSIFPMPTIETCASLPKKLKIKIRPTFLIVKYVNEKGKKSFLYLVGSAAGTMQHELDHLEGKLI